MKERHMPVVPQKQLAVRRRAAQAKESWDLSSEEKVGLAKQRKEQGNGLFKAGKWARAIAKYKSAADTVSYDVSRPPLAHAIPTHYD